MKKVKKPKVNQKKIHDLDLNDLDNKTSKSRFRSNSGGIKEFIQKLVSDFFQLLRRKKEERLTLMFIPHNEKKIKNFHISNLTLTVIMAIFTVTVVLSSVLIINHTSTIQEVDKLKISQKDAKIQFSKISNEIQDMDESFKTIRDKIASLHSLSNGKSASNTKYFGQGGPAEPLASDIQRNNNSDGNSPEAIPQEVFTLNRIIDDMEKSEKPLKDIEKFLIKREKIIKNTPTLWPVEGYIMNPFGLVRNAANLKAYYNPGVDIAAPPGSTIKSTAPGLVVDVKHNTKTGWEVRIRHNYGYETVYKGLDRVVVSLEDKIVKGELIGYLGMDAQSTEGVLHYQIYIGVDAQNPMPYMSYIAE